MKKSEIIAIIVIGYGIAKQLHWYNVCAGGRHVD